MHSEHDASQFEASDSFVVGYESSAGYPYYEAAQSNPYGSYRRQKQPKFSTFMDDQSDTSSMSTALLNGHMSPNFDNYPSSAQNTLDRKHRSP